MNVVTFLILIFVVKNSCSAGAAKQSTTALKSCEKLKIIKQVNDTNELDFAVASEVNVARLKQIDGVKPMHYDWNISFTDTSFRCDVKIKIETVNKVNRLIIDINPAVLTFDADRQVRLIKEATGDIICIKTAISVLGDKKMVLNLNDKTEANVVYLLELGSVTGKLFDNDKDTGSLGIQDGGYTSNDDRNVAFNTIFQMRYARTVFPLFDHPSLKATYTVCIEHSNDTVSASNTPLETRTVLAKNRVKDCYQKTKMVPSYVVTVALLGNFSLVSKKINSNLTLELYHIKSENISAFEHEFDLARKVVDYMQNATKFEYPMTKLGFMNIPNPPFWGVENFGLVSMDAGFTRNAYSTGITIIVHEIIHQWIGDVVTISDWREICLQEGLTAWFEWTISYELDSSSPKPEQKAVTEVRQFLNRWQHSPVIQNFNMTKDIEDRCFGLPPALFQMFTTFYGARIWHSFLSKLFEDFAYSNANITDWANILSAVSNDKSAGEVLKSYFTEIGYPVIFAYKESSGKLILEQFAIVNIDEGNQVELRSGRPFVTPVTILTNKGSLANSTKPLFTESLKKSIPLASNVEWLAINPNRESYTRTVYQPQNYLSMLKCFSGDGQCGLTKGHMENVFDDLCHALVSNWLPMENQTQNADQHEQWNELFSKLHNQTKFKLNEKCECCLRSTDAKDPLGRNCRLFLKRCRTIKLFHQIGRNVTEAAA